MGNLTLLAGHSFFKHSTPSLWRQSDGKWKVKWRDFHTYKFDEIFATEEEARRYAVRINEAPLTVDGDWDDLADADRWWRSMPEPKSPTPKNASTRHRTDWYERLKKRRA